MIQVRTFGALLALGALTALPGCSMFGGGGGGGSQYSAASPSSSYSGSSSAMGSASQTAPRSTAEMNQPVTRDMIRKVQAQLKQDGLYRGHIDGVWGPQSEQAMNSFQQQHNLNETGKIDLQSLQAMNISPGNEQYGGMNNGYGGANNGAMNTGSGNQYGESDTGGQMHSYSGSGNMQTGNENYSTGNQNPTGNSHASNMPYPNNNPPQNSTTGTQTGGYGGNASAPNTGSNTGGTQH